MLRDDVEHTIGIAAQSLALARRWSEGAREDPLFIETLGVTGEERDALRATLAAGVSEIDPMVSYLVAATNAILYKPVAGRFDRIPIPDTHLPAAEGARLIDIGCNWGCWSLAAAAKGYSPIGIDPSLGAVLAAKRLARLRGLPFEGIVADARHLPLRSGAVDAAFSYSVLQHFSKDDARRAFGEIARVVRQGGLVRIQMASATGIRSLQHMARRGFREPGGFDVRYWLPGTLLSDFRRTFRDGRLEVDCYFGLGLQPTDRALYGAGGRALLSISERLRKLSANITPLKLAADSLYLVAHNVAVQQHAGAQ